MFRVLRNTRTPVPRLAQTTTGMTARTCTRLAVTMLVTMKVTALVLCVTAPKRMPSKLADQRVSIRRSRPFHKPRPAIWLRCELIKQRTT